MDELLAWVVFPLAGLAVCTGVGRLAIRLTRAELDPATAPAVGFVASIVLVAFPFALGTGAIPALILLLLAAAAGFASAPPRPGGGAAAGGAVYAMHIAPVALGGTATFLGYNLLNDTAIHLALVDYIGDHGAREVSLAPSSYAAAIDEYVGTSYPLGSHELLAALKPIVGLDPALVYQPFLALAAALAAAAIFGLLRAEGLRARNAGLVAFAALASHLVFSFALQGGIKEITLITCLAAAAGAGAAVVRSPAPVRPAVLVALTGAALYAIYGLYALPWVGGLGAATFVLMLREPLARRIGPPVAAGAAGFLIASLPLIPGSIRYFDHGHDVITAGEELGPLGSPLKVVQVAGVWLRGDYRLAPMSSWITYALCGVVLLLAAVGLFLAIRRRNAGALLLLAPSLLAFALVYPTASPYIDAKVLCVLSPAIVALAALALGALPRGATVVAVVLGGAILIGDALAYRVVQPAPMDRMDELSAIDERFAGRGPILVNEFEEFAKHFARDSRASDPYEKWSAGRVELLRAPSARRRWYDLDEMRPEYVQRWRLIATRRSPVASRPPSNYARVFRGRWYEVWRRENPAPRATSRWATRGLGHPAPRVAPRSAR